MQECSEERYDEMLGVLARFQFKKLADVRFGLLVRGDGLQEVGRVRVLR
jgi:hypothetical protein